MGKVDLHKRYLEATMHLLSLYKIVVYYEQNISNFESTAIMYIIHVLFEACWV